MRPEILADFACASDKCKTIVECTVEEACRECLMIDGSRKFVIPFRIHNERLHKCSSVRIPNLCADTGSSHIQFATLPLAGISRAVSMILISFEGKIMSFEGKIMSRMGTALLSSLLDLFLVEHDFFEIREDDTNIEQIKGLRVRQIVTKLDAWMMGRRRSTRYSPVGKKDGW